MIQRKAGTLGGHDVNLFAGVPVTDYAAALPWYESLIGSPPTFLASDTEAVWELAEQRWLFIVQRPEHAGHAIPTIIVNDIDALVSEIEQRGLSPTKVETYPGGWRKFLYYDADGNEIGVGGGPTLKQAE